jgi:hypothetical protein
MTYRNPYTVFESIHGEYNPDKPHDPPFSVWMREQKQKYLTLFPDAAQNQIYGHFFNAELEKFFRWISENL